MLLGVEPRIMTINKCKNMVSRERLIHILLSNRACDKDAAVTRDRRRPSVIDRNDIEIGENYFIQ